VASLASVGAVSSEQPNGAAAARAHEDPPRHPKTRSDPLNPEDLHPVVMIDDLRAVVRKTDMSHLWIAEWVRVNVGGVIARDL
jgi:hypothetical protein